MQQQATAPPLRVSGRGVKQRITLLWVKPTAGGRFGAKCSPADRGYPACTRRVVRAWLHKSGAVGKLVSVLRCCCGSVGQVSSQSSWPPMRAFHLAPAESGS